MPPNIKNPFRQAQFSVSAFQLSELVKDEGAEVAFVGRSNAGKSSALNTLCDQKSLARTSKTPGRTQLINFFGITEQTRLVDLPGYGFAEVRMEMLDHWRKTLPAYIEQRQCLRGMVLVSDIRTALTDLDLHMLEWCNFQNRPLHILLTKADKLSRGPAVAQLRKIERIAKETGPDISAQLFSATNKLGLDVLIKQLTTWLAIEPTTE